MILEKSLKKSVLKLVFLCNLVVLKAFLFQSNFNRLHRTLLEKMSALKGEKKDDGRSTWKGEEEERE